MAENEVVKVEAQPMVKPVASPAQLHEALAQYKAMQNELDKAMPDCIMTIQGKSFRKKNYWRAVKSAFNLKVECIKEDRFDIGIGGDWGFTVTYRATAPNGACADGDGACTYDEKAKGNMQPTLHNVRAQAHTRAFNRAVSNLVGFGEVSAEEMIDDKRPHSAPAKPKAAPAEKSKSKAKAGCISEAQQKRIYAIAKSQPHEWENDDIKKLLETFGYEHRADIPKGQGGDYDNICGLLELDPQEGLSKAYEAKLGG
jgi:hypothetical protein